LLLGIIYAVAFYFKDKRFSDQKSWKIFTLAALRFLSVAGISILLLGPLLKVNNDQVKNPVVILVQDNSESLKNSTSSLKTIKNQLSDDYQTDAFRFSTTIEPNLTDSLDGATTNLSSVFNFIDETYANQNVGAIVIETDGIFNEGSNPMYQKIGITAPIYFIAKGDTTLKKDIKVVQLYHNNIAYLGDKFIVNVDISAYNFSGNSTTVSLRKLGNSPKTIGTQKINFNKQNYFTSVSFEVPADESGIIPYQIQIASKSNEFSTSNNFRKFYVDVLDARQKILLYANATHPDLAALKKSITKNKNYEVDISIAGDNSSNLESYDLVVFHNLPSVKHSIENEINLLNNRNKPRLFIAGSQIDLPKFNNIQNVIKINANTISDNLVQAVNGVGFKLWEQSDGLKEIIKSYPPLTSKFGKFVASPNTNVLLNQKIGDLETDYPLWLIKTQGGRKEAVIAGEGLWNWRVFNYLQNNTFNEFDELIGKTVQFITIKEDKRKFRTNTNNNLYQSYEKVNFTAELYNDSYEKINEPDAQLKVKNQDGKEFNFTLAKTNDYYEFNAGTFPAGSYTYTGSTSFNGKPLTSSGKFSVKDVKLELANTTADHNLLRNLVDKYGGKLFYENDSDLIIEEIKSSNTLKPVVYSSIKTESALNLKWIMFLLIGLLILEWFVRRMLGNY
jgi:hypothetical protein